ncbi:MAG: DUF402 domain-containing protein [Nostocoides sp.]
MGSAEHPAQGGVEEADDRGEHPAYDPPLARLRTGDLVRCAYTKWGNRRHHTSALLWLGSDEHGHWLGDPVGNTWSGGPTSFVAVTDNVLLVPRDRGFTAMSYEPHPDLHFRVYCDIVTDTRWRFDGTAEVTAIDLDLDVIDPADGSGVWVDDEDEFAEHQISLAYPVEVIAAAEAETARVVEEIRGGAAWSRAATAEVWRSLFKQVLAR